MTKLEELEQRLYEEDIFLFETQTRDIKAAVINYNKKNAIVYDKTKLETAAELNSAFLHEYYHLQTGALYTLDDSLRTRQRREYKANKRLALEYIPIEEVKEKLKKGYLKYEIAEELCITEELLNEAIRIYRNMGEM
jgi:hypothetical protein